ncbi:MAG: MFS transporter [Culturomica sp.]|jgi:PAT family beta-lactamase induction signal transducer AmpG|nr:MFS transporter [Culturomica sp.]
MNNNTKSAWKWVPSLYFAQGLPYVVIATTVSVIMYKKLGISNTDIALYTGWLYLPWVVKPLWSPFIDLIKTKRWWITSMQLLMGAGFAGVALLLPLPFFFQSTLAILWLLAFASATNDIATDGFYMLDLNEKQQSFFVGIRSTFYRLAMIFGQGILIIIAGYLELFTGNIRMAWSITFFILAGIVLALFVYHRYALPHPATDKPDKSVNAKNIMREFGYTFSSFFRKKHIVIALLFMLLYRLSEAMLVKMAAPFMLDSQNSGGLGLATQHVGLAYGTIGVIALTIGGILGGIAISRKSLVYWLLPMALSITLPNVAYVYLAYFMPDNLIFVYLAVALEQFGYGFGFTAYTLYLMIFSQGSRQTAYYAICTGFMALGMMLPGMISGWLQELLGYQHFFLLILVLTIPTLAVIPFVKKSLLETE